MDYLTIWATDCFKFGLLMLVIGIGCGMLIGYGLGKLIAPQRPDAVMSYAR